MSQILVAQATRIGEYLYVVPSYNCVQLSLIRLCSENVENQLANYVCLPGKQIAPAGGCAALICADNLQSIRMTQIIILVHI